MIKDLGLISATAAHKNTQTTTIKFYNSWNGKRREEKTFIFYENRLSTRRRAITREGAKKRNPYDRKKYYDVNNEVLLVVCSSNGALSISTVNTHRRAFPRSPIWGFVAAVCCGRREPFRVIFVNLLTDNFIHRWTSVAAKPSSFVRNREKVWNFSEWRIRTAICCFPTNDLAGDCIKNTKRGM